MFTELDTKAPLENTRPILPSCPLGRYPIPLNKFLVGSGRHHTGQRVTGLRGACCRWLRRHGHVTRGQGQRQRERSHHDPACQTVLRRSVRLYGWSGGTTIAVLHDSTPTVDGRATLNENRGFSQHAQDDLLQGRQRKCHATTPGANQSARIIRMILETGCHHKGTAHMGRPPARTEPLSHPIPILSEPASVPAHPVDHKYSYTVDAVRSSAGGRPYIATSICRPSNTTRFIAADPATRTSMSRRAGASMREPVPSRSVRRRAASRQVMSMRMNAPRR